MTRALSSGHLCLGVILGILLSLVGIQASFFWTFDKSSTGEQEGINVFQPIPNRRYGVPRIRQNFEDQTNVILNNQLIRAYLQASYRYLAMSKYMDRADMARPGFSKFFMEASEREYRNAKTLMDYINKRGGQLEFSTIPTPVRTTWADGLEAVTDSLNVQKGIQKEILGVHTQAEAAGDPHLSQVLEGNFLDQNTELIKKLADYVAQLERLKKDNNSSLGEYVFEQNLK
ncbi:hypothetical protein ACJMK2_005136 [Sinanodonta woodiana]|uniref:Ferritin n=1 Tax=Sinanodonta woodiana TaxID=1069815 RepID=A0ABD3VP76_SINWO